MSLTFATALSNALLKKDVKLDFAYKFFYDDATDSKYLGLCGGSDRQLYAGSLPAGAPKIFYGLILDHGEIVQSLDLARSKASVQNITITCANKLKNTTLAAELFYGTRKYINHLVKIYLIHDSTEDLTNGCLVGNFRFVNINANLETVTIDLEDWSPFDGLKIPNVKSPYGNYQPVAYGDFVQDSEANNYYSKKYFPCPYEKRENNNLYFVTHKELTGTAKLYFYDDGLDRFIAITNGSVNTTEATPVYLSSVPTDLSRVVRIRATNNDGTNNEFDSPGSAWDVDANGAADETTYAKYPQTGYHAVASTGGDVTADYLLSLIFAEPVGVFISLELHVKADATVDYETSTVDEGDSYLSLRNIIFGVNNGLITIYLSELSGADRTESIASATVTDIHADYVSAGYKLDDLIQLNGVWLAKSTGDNETVSGRIYVYDVYLKGTIALDFTNEPDSAETFLKDVKYLYCGADGHTQGYTDGSGIADDIHEVHRDLMDRYAGADYDNDYMNGWTALDTARTGWTARWWQLEPREIKEILEQLQYEGCFIFRLVADSDGSGNAGGQYIWVKDSYSSGDVKYILTNADFADIQLGITPLSDLVTYRKYNFNKHAGKDTFIDQEEYSNTTARSNWNIATSENVIEEDLEALCDCNNSPDTIYNVLEDATPNDSILLYYDNITANPKILVSCNIVNPKRLDLDLGDIVQFSDTNLIPFGESWATLYFMVVETRRTPNSLQIVCREVYNS